MVKSYLAALVIILALVGGIVLAFSKDNHLSKYLPPQTGSKNPYLEGVVMDKVIHGDALNVTLNTPEGVVLASFTSKPLEISMMVLKGSTMTLGPMKYAPFVHNPVIKRVRAPQEQTFANALTNSPVANPQPPKPPLSEKPPQQ